MTTFYTGKGDDGKTNMYGSRIEKDSLVLDILGLLDELQTYLGICKSKYDNSEYKKLITVLQNQVFKIQAEIATRRVYINLADIRFLEDATDEHGKDIKIDSFILTSSNPISASLDYARALARKAERGYYIYLKEINPKANVNSLKFLNRLSSCLFVLSKFFDTEKERVNYK